MILLFLQLVIGSEDIVLNLIHQLGAKSFKDRIAAENQLKEIPADQWVPLLEKNGRENPEVNRKISRLVSESYPYPERTQILKKFAKQIRDSEGYKESLEKNSRLIDCFLPDWERAHKDMAYEYAHQEKISHAFDVFARPKIEAFFPPLLATCNGVRDVKINRSSPISTVFDFQENGEPVKFTVLEHGGFAIDRAQAGGATIDFNALLPPFFSDFAGNRFKREPKKNVWLAVKTIYYDKNGIPSSLFILSRYDNFEMPHYFINLSGASLRHVWEYWLERFYPGYKNEKLPSA